MRLSPTHLVTLGLVSLFAVGCGSNSPSVSPMSPELTVPPQDGRTPPTVPPGSPSSNVPSDIPVYPGATIISVTGDAYQTSVAQLTNAKGPDLIEWVKQYFSTHNATLTNTTLNPSGSSTTLSFQGSGKTYEVRIDAPASGNAFLTVVRR